MIVSHRWRFVYIGSPKTASTTLHHWLSGPIFDGQKIIQRPFGQHCARVPERCWNYFIFASWCDPIERAVKLWAHSQREIAFRIDTHRMGFAEFVQAWQPTVGWFYGAGQAELLAAVPRLDGLVRVDRLEADLFSLPPIKAVVEAARGIGGPAEVMGGIPIEPIPRLNRTRHPAAGEVVTPELRRAIVGRWAADYCLVRA